MLNPDARSTYTSSLCPPVGYVFDQALATTFSLDMITLLSIPTHFILANRQGNRRMDGIEVFEALRKTTRRLSVYVQKAQIKAPQESNVLCSLLEPMVIEVRAPRGGSFHPKIWLLRFIAEEDPERSLLRLMILSRNLTADRSWDISLQLDGVPSRRNIGANRQLGELIRDLPSFADVAVSEDHVARAAHLAEELRRTVWEPPNGFESISFHVLGRSRGKWHPPESDAMAVISPFLRKGALRHLSRTTKRLEAVLSRPDELDALTSGSGVTALARDWWVLEEAAEREDGEELADTDSSGLHAKAYALHCGKEFRLFLGSANATDKAILHSKNIEVLAELKGKKSASNSIDSLFGPEGLEPVLSRYSPPKVKQPKDPLKEAALRALELARETLAEGNLKVVCTALESSWSLVIAPAGRIPLGGIRSIRVWPISVARDRAVDAFSLSSATPVPLGNFGASSVTGLIGFEMEAEASPERAVFVLNLPVENLPRDRDDAILRTVVENREGFLRYLMLLLGDLGEGLPQVEPVQSGMAWIGWKCMGEGYPSLLEELTRALGRDPDRLKDIDAVVRRLSLSGGEIVPPEFLALWRIFAEALGVQEP